MSGKVCFIASPIGLEESSERKNSDFLYEILEDVLKDEGFTKIERADKINHGIEIDSVILSKLKSSDLVIADVTGHNPNVFLEIGYRQSLNKPILLVCNKKEGRKLPFDISMKQTLYYSEDYKTVLEFKDNMSEAVGSLEEDMQKEKSSNINMSKEEMLTMIIGSTDSLMDSISSLSRNTRDYNISSLDYLEELKDKIDYLLKVSKKIPATRIVDRIIYNRTCSCGRDFETSIEDNYNCNTCNNIPF